MKEFKSSTEKNYSNLNTNKCNKTPMTDITKKPIIRYHLRIKQLFKGQLSISFEQIKLSIKL